MRVLRTVTQLWTSSVLPDLRSRLANLENPTREKRVFCGNCNAYCCNAIAEFSWKWHIFHTKGLKQNIKHGNPKTNLLTVVVNSRHSLVYFYSNRLNESEDIKVAMTFTKKNVLVQQCCLTQVIKWRLWFSSSYDFLRHDELRSWIYFPVISWPNFNKNWVRIFSTTRAWDIATPYP